MSSVQLLMNRIRQGLPDRLRIRYAELIGKRQAQSLSSEEHSELLALSDHVEALEAERAQALVDLARIRQQPLDVLLHELQIAPIDWLGS